ncbi:MAG: hypothetical protein ACKO85_11645 [Isosphaeraceae bacterium]
MALKRPGHAAVAVMHGGWVQEYVSWWPLAGKRDNASANPGQRFRTGKANDITGDFVAEMGANTRNRLAAGTIQPRAGQMQDTTDFYTDHRINVDNPNDSWIQAPTHVIAIPTCDDVEDKAAGTVRLGLNESNLLDWWAIYKNKVINPTAHHEYNFVSKRYNCASVAMAALIAAGGDIFKKHSKAWAYYSPNDIRDYANELRREIDRLNSRMQTVQNGILGDYRKYMPDTRQKFGVDYLHSTSGTSTRVVEIWRTEEWRRQSAVMIGRRKDQVRNIDTLMEQYWSLGEGWTAQNLPLKATIISSILAEVQSHLIEKPNSDRREAVLKLGSQCIAVIRYHAAQSQNNMNELMTYVGTLT